MTDEIKNMDSPSGVQLTLQGYVDYQAAKLAAARTRHLLHATADIAPSAKFQLIDAYMNNDATREAMEKLFISQVARDGTGSLSPLAMPALPALPAPQLEGGSAGGETESGGRSSVDSSYGAAPESGINHEEYPPRLQYTPRLDKFCSRPGDHPKLRSSSNRPVERYQNIVMMTRTGKYEGRLAYLDYGADINLMSPKVANDLGLDIRTAKQPKLVSVLVGTINLRKVVENISWRAERGKKTKKTSFWVPDENIEVDILFGKPFMDEDDLNDFCDQPTEAVHILIARKQKESEAEEDRKRQEEAERQARELDEKRKAAQKGAQKNKQGKK